MSQLSVLSSLSGSQSLFAERLNQGSNNNVGQEAAIEQRDRTVLSGSTDQGVRVTLGTYRSAQTELSSSSGVQAYQAVASQADANPYATNILNAISGQLARDLADDATPGELQSRLESGLEGFLEGFDQAFNELQSAGILSSDIQAEIEQTRDQVLNGLASLAQTYGLSSDAVSQAQERVAQAGGSDDNLDNALQGLGSRFATQVQGGQAQLRDFSFSLQTADGDTVDIRASAYDASAFYADSQGNRAFQTQQGSGFSLSVQGDLDEQELVAINDLLSQVGQLTDTFFNGDIFDAFEEALSVGFDTNEITQFALNLTRTDIQAVSSTYTDVANNFNSDDSQSLQQRLAPLGDFARDVQRAGLIADLLGQDASIVSQLVARISDTFFSERDNTGQAERFVSTVLDATS